MVLCDSAPSVIQKDIRRKAYDFNPNICHQSQPLNALNIPICRRSGNSTEGFIDTSSMEPILAVRLGLTALNRGAGVLEAATGKTLFPMK